MNTKQPDKAPQTSTAPRTQQNEQQEFEISQSEESLESHRQVLETLKEKILSQDSPPHTSEPSGNERSTDLGMPAGKNYFRVREVAALLNIGPHVLRFWESEFSMVRPTKSRSGQRVYRRKDVELLARIQHLLHEKKMSIRVAREVLLKERKERAQQPATLKQSARTAGNSTSSSALDLKEILVDLRQMMALAKKDPFSFKPGN